MSTDSWPRRARLHTWWMDGDHFASEWYREPGSWRCWVWETVADVLEWVMRNARPCRHRVMVTDHMAGHVWDECLCCRWSPE